MSILEKYNNAHMNKDEAAMNEILHDDYKFTMHASGSPQTQPATPSLFGRHVQRRSPRGVQRH